MDKPTFKPMTPTDLPAGRELDAVIAQTLFGYKRPGPESPVGWLCKTNMGPFADCDCESHLESEKCPDYSTNMEDAWQVVEKLRRDGYEVELDGFDLCGNAIWECVLNGHGHEYGGKSKEPAEAICRAALKAIEATAPAPAPPADPLLLEPHGR